MLRGEAEGTGEWATCPSRGQGLRDAPQLPLTPEQVWGGAGWAPGAQSRLVPSSSPVGSLLLESLPLGRAPPSTAGTKEEGQQEGINTEKVPGERPYSTVPCPPPWRLPEESLDHAGLGRHLHGPQGLPALLHLQKESISSRAWSRGSRGRLRARFRVVRPGDRPSVLAAHTAWAHFLLSPAQSHSGRVPVTGRAQSPLVKGLRGTCLLWQTHQASINELSPGVIRTFWPWEAGNPQQSHPKHAEADLLIKMTRRDGCSP